MATLRVMVRCPINVGPAFLLAVVLCAGCRSTDVPPHLDVQDDLAQKRHAVLVAQHPTDKAKAYRALFADQDPDVMAALVKDPDVGIALQAAWETSVVPVVAKKDRYLTPLDPAPLRRFIGHVGERVGTAVPTWWQESILTAYTRDDGRYLFAGPESKAHKTLHPNGDLRIKSPASTVLRKRGEGIEIVREGTTVTLPNAPDATIRARFMQDYCQIELGENISVVALYTPWGTSYALVGVSMTRDAVLWEREAWGSSWRTLTGGRGSAHQLSMTRTEDHILLFGGDMEGMYIEAYEVRTGKSIFRFCTGYWSVLGEGE